MQKHILEELKTQNNNSAKAIGFLSAAIIALIAWGFINASLPAFLLASVFIFNLMAESKAYKKSCTDELKAAESNNLMMHLTNKQNNDKVL